MLQSSVLKLVSLPVIAGSKKQKIVEQTSLPSVIVYKRRQSYSFYQIVQLDYEREFNFNRSVFFTLGNIFLRAEECSVSSLFNLSKAVKPFVKSPSQLSSFGVIFPNKWVVLFSSN